MTTATSRQTVTVGQSPRPHQLSSFPRLSTAELVKRESILTLLKKAKWIPAFAGMTALVFSTLAVDVFANEEEEPVERTYIATPAAPAFQSWDDAQGKSSG